MSNPAPAEFSSQHTFLEVSLISYLFNSIWSQTLLEGGSPGEGLDTPDVDFSNKVLKVSAA